MFKNTLSTVWAIILLSGCGAATSGGGGVGNRGEEHEEGRPATLDDALLSLFAPDVWPPAASPEGPCLTSYYNEQWRFGLDIPVGFTGPEVVSSFPSKFKVEFTHPDSEHILIAADVREASSGLDHAVDRWIGLLTEDGHFELLDREGFVTANGGRAHLLWLRFTDGVPGEEQFDLYSIESWTIGEFGAYVVHTGAFRDNYFALAASLEAAARSICTD